MKAIYTMPAIPPYCKEVKTEVEVIKWMGDRVLVRDIAFSARIAPHEYLIETDLASIELIP